MRKITSITLQPIPEEASTISVDTSEKIRYTGINIFAEVETTKECDEPVIKVSLPVFRSVKNTNGYDLATITEINNGLRWLMRRASESGVVAIPVVKEQKFTPIEGTNDYLIEDTKVVFETFSGKEVKEKHPIGFKQKRDK